MTTKNVIISLFDFTGTWSKPFRENGYEVYQVDIQNGVDIMKWDFTSIPKDNVLGILAAIPCTDYAVSGARWFAKKDTNGQTEKSQRLVAKTKEIIDYFQPTFWVVENPISRIHTLNPWLGKPIFYFNPNEFAGYGFPDETYTKKTALYGKFAIPIKKELPINKIDGNTRIHYPKDENGKSVPWGSLECKNIRSKTPEGFSLAFYEANKGGEI